MDESKKQPAKPYSLRLSMDADEDGNLGRDLMEMAGKTVSALMQRTREHGGRVTLECDARTVFVQWTPET